jgi:hypothetical protein
VLRILFIDREMCGALQLHISNLVEGSGSRLRLHDREPVMSPEIGQRLRAIREERVLEEQKLADVTQDLLKALKGYPPKLQKEILEKVHRENEELIRMRDAIAKDEAERDQVEEELKRILPGFREKWEEVTKRVRKVPIPPSSSSANNVEALLMAAAYVFDPVYSFALSYSPDPSRLNELVAKFIGYYSMKNQAVLQLLHRMDGQLRGQPYSGSLQDFGRSWMYSGFPKLEVGHKLAATLALTDVPDDMEIIAPWKCWSLIMPPGLLGDDPNGCNFARLWCEGSEVRFMVNSLGEIMGPVTREQMLRKPSKYPMSLVACEAMDSLVRGACLALSNPDDYKRQKLSEKNASAPKKPSRDGLPDFSVSRFMLSAPVQIDLREYLHDTLMGKKHQSGGAPTVQFFVRGHWRNQAHGPRMSLRKQMRIEGYWKGPEHGAVKLGNYKVKDDDGNDSGAGSVDATEHRGT